MRSKEKGQGRPETSGNKEKKKETGETDGRGKCAEGMEQNREKQGTEKEREESEGGNRTNGWSTRKTDGCGRRPWRKVKRGVGEQKAARLAWAGKHVGLQQRAKERERGRERGTERESRIVLSDLLGVAFSGEQTPFCLLIHRSLTKGCSDAPLRHKRRCSDATECASKTCCCNKPKINVSPAAQVCLRGQR